MPLKEMGYDIVLWKLVMPGFVPIVIIVSRLKNDSVQVWFSIFFFSVMALKTYMALSLASPFEYPPISHELMRLKGALTKAKREKASISPFLFKLDDV